MRKKRTLRLQRLAVAWNIRNALWRLIIVGLYLIQARSHERVSGILNAIHVSSLPQLLVLLLRSGPSTLRERTRCWHLLRRARKGQNLTQAEWTELMNFATERLLKKREARSRAYTVEGRMVWAGQLVTI